MKQQINASSTVTDAVRDDLNREPDVVRAHIGDPARLRTAAAVLEVFLGIGAAGGGLALMLGPHGEILPLPMTVLRGSPFSSFFIPGLILFAVLGCGSLVVAHLTWRRHPWGPQLALVVGVALLIWMAVEITVIGYANSPPLQPLYIALGVIISAVGIAWLRHRAHHSRA